MRSGPTPAGMGPLSYGQREEVSYPRFHGVPYTGILSGPSEDLRGIMRGNRILNNRVFHTNRLLNDGGGIYVRGEQGTSYADGLVIAGNAVTDSDYGGEWGVGIYTDDSTNWATVDRNAVYDYCSTRATPAAPAPPTPRAPRSWPTPAPARLTGGRSTYRDHRARMSAFPRGRPGSPLASATVNSRECATIRPPVVITR